MKFKEWWNKWIGNLTWRFRGSEAIAQDAWDAGAYEERKRWLATLREQSIIEIEGQDSEMVRSIIEKGIDAVIDKVFLEEEKERDEKRRIENYYKENKS